MINNEQLKQQLDKSPSQKRITPDVLKSKVSSFEFHRLSDTMTVCNLQTVNGFNVIGKSACADPANYNKEIGEKVAFDDAFNQLWALEGYLLREKISEEVGFRPTTSLVAA